MPIRVIDRAGRVLAGATVAITGVAGPNSRGYVTRNPSERVFVGPLGRRMLVASFGGWADTTFVHVVARPAP